MLTLSLGDSAIYIDLYCGSTCKRHASPHRKGRGDPPRSAVVSEENLLHIGTEVMLPTTCAIAPAQ